MRLYVWRGAARNFGDELNTVVWPRLLPGLLDPHGPVLLLGIGSVLDARHGQIGRKIVAGAGYGGYERPASLDRSWHVYWVRGPRTARRLGLPERFGLGDPACLLPLVHTPIPTSGPRDVGFMPHFESLSRGAWAAAAAAAGVRLIDPRGDPAAICDAIARCRVLLSEALHGVIVADALRVPWVALRPVAPIHRMKWLDWADTMALEPRFHPLPGSSSREWIEARCARAGPRVRAMLAAAAEPLLPSPAYLDHAVAALRRAAAEPAQLSSATALDRAQGRMLTRLHTLRQDCAGRPAMASGPLRPGGKSAYVTASVG